jgi:DNA-binding response OmpR family regulator/S1-C subfamily serine protease
MISKAERLLVIASDNALREGIGAILSNAGYEVSNESADRIQAIVEFDPEVIVLAADPPQLDCCDILSHVKSSDPTQYIRVVMLSPGGSAERTRGLDLGADDVLSLPFDPQEFLSRVRLQLRSKHSADELRERLRLAEESRNANQQVVAVVDEERRMLRVGGLATFIVLIAAAVFALLFFRRTQEQNTRVYTAITHLQAGILTQRQLMERSRAARGDVERGLSSAGDLQKIELQKESERLRSKIAISQTNEASALQSHLEMVESRLQKLETQNKFAETAIKSNEASICLIHVAVAFRDRATGLRLHYAGLTSNGEPTVDQNNNPLVSLTGSGPEVRLDAFGTGFLASNKGQILTNHHVAEPWWQNDELKEMLDQGLEPTIVEMAAYFPGVPHGVAVKTENISSAADMAVLEGNVSMLGIGPIALADGRRSAVTGAPVVLLGYPTALDAILARAGAETLRSIASASNGDPKQVMEELAHRHLIRPIATQGHIGDILPDKIVYDAQTASGGSGGPLFNSEGKVIGINFAMVREFGGSNFAIPVGYGKALLKP